MAERTRILGGTLMIDSELGRGTVVELSVPVAFEPAKRASVAVAEKVIA
jgi:chemotaxis protein histidine kinase CheA